MTKNEALNPTQKLVEILQTLRGPEGCNWDKKQTLETMEKHIKSESDELSKALIAKDLLNIKEELGDLLMTIVLTSQIAKEEGYFNFDAVVEGICEKMIHRHPHIFRTNSSQITSKEVEELWEKQKAKEKANKTKISYQINEYLDFNNPLIAANKIQSIAAEVGFDFPSIESAFSKIPEEVKEIEESLGHKEKLEEELGDLLFATVNVLRIAKIDPCKSLEKANKKFAKRFEKVEELALTNGGFNNKTIEELDKYWDKSKEQGL